MLLLAAAWLAVLASLLPSFTSQLGPPSYQQKKKGNLSIFRQKSHLLGNMKVSLSALYEIDGVKQGSGSVQF